MIMITKKVKVITLPENDKKEQDKAYTYIRDGMEAQSIFSNEYISHLFTIRCFKIGKI